MLNTMSYLMGRTSFSLTSGFSNLAILLNPAGCVEVSTGWSHPGVCTSTLVAQWSTVMHRAHVAKEPRVGIGSPRLAPWAVKSQALPFPAIFQPPEGNSWTEVHRHNSHDK